MLYNSLALRNTRGLTVFTLIAYKNNAEDRCRGHLMASYDSAFQFHNNLLRDALIDKWAELLLRNKNADYHEGKFECVVMKDGITVFDNGHVTWDGNVRYEERFGFQTDDYWLHFDKMEAEEREANIEMTEIHTEANKKAEELYVAKKKQEHAETQKKRQAALEAAIATRQQQLLELKKEFAE
jgi:hypothetical protein